MHSIANLIARIIVLSPLIYFMYFPFEYNADFDNYYPNYTLGLFTYDYLFEWLSFFFREILELDFYIFWFYLVVIQVVLLALIYTKMSIVILSYPSVIAMSQFFFGTQIRYSIAILLGLAVIANFRSLTTRLFFIFISFLLHYGSIISLFALAIEKKLDDNVLKLKGAARKISLLLIAAAFFIALYKIDAIISMTRFSYYINSDTYMGQTSLVSKLYIVVAFLLIYLWYVLSNKNALTSIKMGLILLVFALLTSPIAALSGRILLVYFIVEPLIIYSLFSRLKTITLILAMCYLALYILRFTFYLYNSNFYFYQIL